MGIGSGDARNSLQSKEKFRKRELSFVNILKADNEVDIMLQWLVMTPLAVWISNFGLWLRRKQLEKVFSDAEAKYRL